MMRAAVIDGYGGSDRLVVREVESPAPPGGGEVLVRVRAAGVNPLDWKIRSGRMRLILPARFPLVLGFDAAGEVEAIGPEVTRFAPGDPVFGSVSGGRGAYAQFALAREAHLMPVPEGFSFEEAAALPGSGLTALQALRDRGELARGERVLIHGAAGGVGHFAVQIARALGAQVTAVASGRNQDFLRELGADRTIDYEEEDFTFEDDTWEVVFDAVGLRSYREVEPVLAPDGGIFVTTAVGPVPFAWTALTAAGALLGRGKRARIVFVKPNGADLADLALLAEQNRLRPFLQEVFPLDEVGRAHDLSQAGHVRGKLVLRVG